MCWKILLTFYNKRFCTAKNFQGCMQVFVLRGGGVGGIGHLDPCLRPWTPRYMSFYLFNHRVDP